MFLRYIACFAEKQRKSKDRRNLGPQGTTRRSKQNQSLMKNDRTCKKGETIVGSYTLMGKGTKYSSSAKRENSDWVIHEIENDWAGGEKKQWNSETVKQRNSEVVKQYFCLLFARICSCFPQQNNKTLATCLLCRQNKGKLGFKTKGNTGQIIVVSLFSDEFHHCSSIKTLFRLIWGFSLYKKGKNYWLFFSQKSGSLSFPLKPFLNLSYLLNFYMALLFF